MGGRERKKEKGTEKTNSGSGSSELGGRERKKKDERSSELECKKIAPAIFN